MASFASVAELQTSMGVTFTAGAAADQAQAKLDQATAEMKSYMHQDIAQATETVTLDPEDRGVVMLPQFPVTAVTSMVVDGVTLNVTTDVDWYRSGILKRDNSATWGSRRQTIVVNYTHGYVTIPDDLKSVCKARAERLLDNPTAVANEQAGSYSGNYGPVAEEAFTPAEKRTMDRYSDMAAA
jgi:hypothetical protein